jgi:hypothetical protein
MGECCMSQCVCHSNPSTNIFLTHCVCDKCCDKALCSDFITSEQEKLCEAKKKKRTSSEDVRFLKDRYEITNI